MRIHVWTFRIPALPHIRFVALSLAVLALAASLAAQSLQPTSVNGRVVWTNDTPGHSGEQTVRATHPAQLFYWSNVELRWKPIRPATPSALHSAQVVAGEVSTYIESRPRLDSHPAPIKGELAARNPNYSTAAANRLVTAAEIDRYINEAAARNHVDPNLVRALVKVESNFNPRAISNKGAMGLMQLMPATARMYVVRNPFDSKQNVEAGVRHLKGLLDNFRGDVSLTLAAYNAGQGAVQRSGGIPPYTETRNYVKRITNLMGGSPVVRFSSLPMPIHVSRDERGILVITNTD